MTGAMQPEAAVRRKSWPVSSQAAVLHAMKPDPEYPYPPVGRLNASSYLAPVWIKFT